MPPLFASISMGSKKVYRLCFHLILTCTSVTCKLLNGGLGFILWTWIYMGQFPRKLPHGYKNASRLNRYNFPTDNAWIYIMDSIE